MAKHTFRGLKEVFNQMERHVQIPAEIESWNLLYEFLQKFIEEVDVDFKIKNEILISAEEIFVNVAKYAYPDSSGDVLINAEFYPQNGVLRLKFKDCGIPFDPTKLRNPDVSLDSRQRKIGGLGIFIVRKMMDDMQYFYEDGFNNLLIAKKIKFV